MQSDALLLASLTAIGVGVGEGEVYSPHAEDAQWRT